MNNKTLGIIGILCAPFLCISTFLDDLEAVPWTSGLHGLIYMIGWACSIIALYRDGAVDKTIFSIQMIFLFIAQVWNIMVIFDAPRTNAWYLLDTFWPLSNLCMIAVGVSVIIRKRIHGWKRYIPLIAGLWLPYTFGMFQLLGGKIPAIPYVGLYSAIAWILLGIVAYTTGIKRTEVYGARNS